jgi:hypothetical protein
MLGWPPTLYSMNIRLGGRGKRRSIYEGRKDHCSLFIYLFVGLAIGLHQIDERFYSFLTPKGQR